MPFLTEQLTISEPQNPLTDEFYVLQNANRRFFGF